MNNRRVQMAAMASVFLPGCMLQPKAPVDESAQRQASIDQKLKEKFRGIAFYEFKVTKLDDLGPYENALPVIYLPNGRTIAQTTPAGQHYEISDRRPVPTHLKLVWHAKGSRFRPNNEYLKPPLPIFEGEIQGEITFPVAERIPDDLLDDLRRDPRGTLRIKVRLHRDGVLLGWDIERRPGFDPKKRDRFGEAAYVAPVHSFAGGDFREADIYNGKPIRKGWYIHPKTGQRIETDF